MDNYFHIYRHKEYNFQHKLYKLLSPHILGKILGNFNNFEFHEMDKFLWDRLKHIDYYSNNIQINNLYNSWEKCIKSILLGKACTLKVKDNNQLDMSSHKFRHDKKFQ